MSSVMHPQGPQPQNTYWLRRAGVVAGVLVALALLWWVLSSLFGGGSGKSTVQATPQNPPSLAVDPALASLTPTPTPVPSTSTTPGASTSPTPSTSGSATPSASPSASASTSSTPSATPSSTPTPSGTVDCLSAPLKLALTGDSTPKISAAEAFTVTITNTGSSPCKLALESGALALKVTSGSDSIWSSSDCAAWGAKIPVQQVAAGKSVTWKTTWKTVRSVGTCTPSSEELRSGTYVARATLGDQAARLVMQLHF